MGGGGGGGGGVQTLPGGGGVKRETFPFHWKNRRLDEHGGEGVIFPGLPRSLHSSFCGGRRGKGYSSWA